MEVQAVLPMELGLPVTEKTMSLEHSLMWLPRARTLSGLLRQRMAQGKGWECYNSYRAPCCQKRQSCCVECVVGNGIESCGLC